MYQDKNSQRRGHPKHSSKLWPSKNSKASQPNKENQRPPQSLSQERKRKDDHPEDDAPPTKKFTFGVLLPIDPDCDAKEMTHQKLWKLVMAVMKS